MFAFGSTPLHLPPQKGSGSLTLKPLIYSKSSLLDLTPSFSLSPFPLLLSSFSPSLPAFFPFLPLNVFPLIRPITVSPSRSPRGPGQKFSAHDEYSFVLCVLVPDLQGPSVTGVCSAQSVSTVVQYEINS